MAAERAGHAPRTSGAARPLLPVALALAACAAAAQPDSPAAPTLQPEPAALANAEVRCGAPDALLSGLSAPSEPAACARAAELGRALACVARELPARTGARARYGDAGLQEFRHCVMADAAALAQGRWLPPADLARQWAHCRARLESAGRAPGLPRLPFSGLPLSWQEALRPVLPAREPDAEPARPDGPSPPPRASAPQCADVAALRAPRLAAPVAAPDARPAAPKADLPSL